MILTRLLLSCLLLTPFYTIAIEVGHPVQFSDEVSSSDPYMGLQLRGMLSLNGSPALAELSDLAWDEDEQILYGITDRGLLLHFAPRFSGDRLTGMELLKHHPLLEKKGVATKGARKDSEGLTLQQGNNGIKGDSQLLISFERDHRIARYQTDGTYIEKVKKPSKMGKKRFRTTSNKGMEGITTHPLYGIITANERPRKKGNNTLFSSSGKSWHYPTTSEYDSLVAIETLPDTGLLLLRRAYQNILSPLVITLWRVSPESLGESEALNPELVAEFDTTRGWRTQNFEGLSHHQGNRYFMASDDNGMSLGRTQLIYFELLE